MTANAQPENAKVFTLFTKGERTTVCIIETNETYLGGTLMISSGFGTYAHHWPNTGMPFEEYLQKLSFDSFATKTLGHKGKTYDGEATFQAIVDSINESYEGTVAASLLSTVADYKAEILESALGYQSAVSNLQFQLGESEIEEARNLFDDPGHFWRNKPNPMALQFWEEVWPDVLAYLRKKPEEN